MSAAVEENIQITTNPTIASPQFLEDAEALNDDKINLVTAALQNADNLDQFLEQINTPVKTKHVTLAIDVVSPATATGSPIKMQSISSARSPTQSSNQTAYLTRLWNPMLYVNSSDEEECTFQPKVNANAAKLSGRQTIATEAFKHLYQDAFDRTQKTKEFLDGELTQREKTATFSKMNKESVRLVLLKLQKAMSALILGVDDAKDGELGFEGLGTVFYRLGLFQNLEFTQKADDGEKSQVSINQAKVKPERLTKEIQFHEHVWKILLAVSKEGSETVSAELLLKVLMVLVEERCPISESGFFLTEIIESSLENKDYAQLSKDKELWSLNKVVLEFRRLFDDKTAFMAVYNTSNLVGGTARLDTVKYQQDEFTFTPKILEKSIKLDAKYFTKNMLVALQTLEANLQDLDVKSRNKRLYKYAKYLKDKKNVYLEARLNEEIAPYTFVPKIKDYKSNRPNESLNQSAMSPSRRGYFTQALLESARANRHIILYESAKQYKEKLQQKAYNFKKKDELEENEACSFRPKINHNYAVSPQRSVHPSQGVPAGYKKVIQRLKKGEQKRTNFQTEYERIPRGENYEKNRNSDFNPPKFLERPKITKKEVLVYVDVNIGGGRTGRIAIHKGDDARSLAKHFSNTYSLNSTMRESLEKLLQSYIDSYFAQMTTSQEEQVVEFDNAEQEHHEEDGEEEEEESDDEQVEVDAEHEEALQQQHHDDEEHHEEEEDN
jgi:hypothetical protein